MRLEPVKWAVHCVGVIVKFTKGYGAWIAYVTSKLVSFVVMIENPFSGMPTTCWTVASWRYRVGASQSSSDCRLFVGAMFASILATCSRSAKEWKLVEWFDFSTFFALLGFISSLHSSWCKWSHRTGVLNLRLWGCRRCLYQLGRTQRLRCCWLMGCSCTLPPKWRRIQTYRK